MSIPELRIAPELESPSEELAVMLTGGGARAAYQLGLLKGLARHFSSYEERDGSGGMAGLSGCQVVGLSENATT